MLSQQNSNPIQSGAIITQSIITWYFTHHCIDWHNIVQNLDSQKTLHTSPSWASYGVSIVNILEQIGHAITAPHCSYIVNKALMCPHQNTKVSEQENAFENALPSLLGAGWDKAGMQQGSPLSPCYLWLQSGAVWRQESRISMTDTRGTSDNNWKRRIDRKQRKHLNEKIK